MPRKKNPRVEIVPQSEAALVPTPPASNLQAAARLNWRASDQPAWLNAETYREKIQPRLAEIAVPIISSALGVSKPYATDIRAGRRIPHPRHWLALARLVRVLPDG
jgi:hypothetical protein